MIDKTSSQLNENELKFAGHLSFFDTSMSFRLLSGLLFFIALFLFLHFRDIGVEYLELGSIQPRYVVAQIDFNFKDDEASNILKQEAVRNIGKIYKLSEKEIIQRRADFENELLKNESLRNQVNREDFEKLYKALDILQKSLIQLRFTDPRTFTKMNSKDFPLVDYQIFTPGDISKEVALPVHLWTHLKQEDFPESLYPPSMIDLILQYFQESSWEIEEDIPAQRKLRKIIQSTVPEKITHVSAGSRIIDQGEKVSMRHVAMMQAMKQALREKRNLKDPFTLLGTFIIASLLTLLSLIYLKQNYPQILVSNRKLSLLVTILILSFGIAKGVEYFLLSSSPSLSDLVRFPLLVPLPVIIICSLFNSSLALFATGFLIVVYSMGLSFDETGFIVLNAAASLVVIMSMRSLRKRTEIFTICGKAAFVCILIIIGLQFYENAIWSSADLGDILSTIIFMLLTAVLTLGSLPFFEAAFNVLSDVSLTEYMDPNHDLLRRLSFEAPGTYQHTLVVCNLAEASALAIKANGLFCRVATLFHDIGKLATPQYFTENQLGEVDVHLLLTPKESAQTIISHVSEGVSLARKAGLPEQFIDIIKEHHGTTLAYYFWRKQLDQLGGNLSLINEEDFRYAGPKPRSKESAIIMIADSFEAASRSLDHVNEETLTELINRLVAEKASDGQFDECLLTLEELAIVKRTMVNVLVAGLHSRIKYPKREAKV